MDVQLHQAIPAPVPTVTIDPVTIDPVVFALLLFIIIGLFTLYRYRLKIQKHELTQDDQWLFG